MRKSGLNMYKQGSDDGGIIVNTDPSKGIALIGIEPKYLPMHLVPRNEVHRHNPALFYECPCDHKLEVDGPQFIVIHQSYEQ